MQVNKDRTAGPFHDVILRNDKSLAVLDNRESVENEAMVLSCDVSPPSSLCSECESKIGPVTVPLTPVPEEYGALQASAQCSPAPAHALPQLAPSGLLMEGVWSRETVIAEDYIPGVVDPGGGLVLQVDPQQASPSYALYTYWLYHPAEAAAQKEFDGKDEEVVDDGKPPKAFFFAAASDTFIWTIGCTPVYQDVLMPVTGFSCELRLALHRAGWMQTKIDIARPTPYYSFHDWSLAHIRQIQAKYALTASEYLEIVKPVYHPAIRRRLSMPKLLQGKPAGDEDEDVPDENLTEEWTRFSGLLQEEHLFLQTSYLGRSQAIQVAGKSENDTTSSNYHMLTGKRVLPLHNNSKRKRLPPCLLKSAELPPIPLTQHHRMRWTIVKGKVVKKRRHTGENQLAREPSLSPVNEGLNGFVIDF
eukprot:scpid54482/ scgid9408/ 